MAGNGWPSVLQLLIEERDKLNGAIEALQAGTKRRGRPPRSQQTQIVSKRRGMSAEARKAQSARMKAYWAAKRKAKRGRGAA
jgi:hypothetical protein